MSLVSEFKAFAMRGNVVDLAVGVVIGAAFGKIVASLVDGIIMPIIGLLVGGVNFSDLAITMKEAVVGPDGKEVAAAVLFKYGAFLQTVVDFIIIAFAIFLVVKLMNRLKRKQDAEPPKPAELSAEAKLLTEIRDALQARPIETRLP
jgi:large conductance mechanosensitive channel